MSELRLNTDGHIIKFGADNDVSLTHVADAGLLLNSTMKLQFNDASQFIQGSSATVLSIGATNEIDLTATAVDLNGTLDVSGTSQFNSAMVLAGTTPTLTIGDAGAEDTKIVFDGNAQDYHIGLDDTTDDLVIGLGSALGTTSYLNIDEAGEISTGGETAPDVGAGGLCLDANAGDGYVVTFKNSDVAHGMTDHAETDTYMQFTKVDDSTGGLKIKTFSENETAVYFQTSITNDNTTQSASGTANFEIDARKKNGTDIGAHGANANLFCVSNAGSARFFVDEDGDILYDGGASAYDAYDDAQLVRAFDMNRAPDAIIQSKFDKFVDYNYDDLKKTGILGHLSTEEEAEGQKPFIKIGALQRLHNGAIWQQYEKHQQLLEAVYDLAKEAVGKEKANAILDKHEVKRLN